MKAFFQYLLVPLIFAAVAPSARASFSILPMEVHQQMQTGNNQLTNDIEVYNSTDEPQHIAASVMDWTLTPDGEYKYSEPNTEALSCARMIQVSPPEFNLAPKKSVRVRYTVTATENFSAERHAMIFFQSRPVPVKNRQGMSLLVGLRMGCKVFVSPPATPPNSAKITDMTVENAPRRRVKVSVQNTAATTFRAQGTMQVRDENKAVVAQGKLTSAQILPGATRNLWFDLNAAVPAGDYVLETVIDFGEKQLIGGELKTKVQAAPEATPVLSPVTQAASSPDLLPTSTASSQK